MVIKIVSISLQMEDASDIDNCYFVALENQSVDNEPYTPVVDFDNISLTELENIVTRHLKVSE
jgi:hypothetical protein